MRLEFHTWECGHHGQRPEPIDGLTSVVQAQAILRAVAAAISQPGSGRAWLVDDAESRVKEFYLADDHVSACCAVDSWLDIPVVLVGPGLVGNRRAIDALGWHLNLVDDCIDGWDGKRPLGGYHDGCFATTALSADQVRALPRRWASPPLRVVEVTPELLATAMQDAAECGFVPVEVAMNDSAAERMAS